MKKTYRKPQINEHKVDKEVLRMLDPRNFADLFWEKLAEARRTEPATTHEQVFDMLNDKYMNAMGAPRYSCYDSFRQRLNER
jgi:hypothetical protein